MKHTQENRSSEGQDSKVEEINILFAGFPHNIQTEDVRVFLSDICGINRFTMIKKHKGRFRGYAFIHVQSQKEADFYTTKEFKFQGKVLDTKVVKQHNEHIKFMIKNLFEPSKLFIRNIPKKFEKNSLKKAYSHFGNILEVLITIQENKIHNNAFITFETHLEAQNCFNSKPLKFGKQFVTKISWARPNLSSYMTCKLNKKVRDHIKLVCKGDQEYNPGNFLYLREIIEETGNIDVLFCGNDSQLKITNGLINKYSDQNIIGIRSQNANSETTYSSSGQKQAVKKNNNSTSSTSEKYVRKDPSLNTNNPTPAQLDELNQVTNSFNKMSLNDYNHAYNKESQEQTYQYQNYTQDSEAKVDYDNSNAQQDYFNQQQDYFNQQQNYTTDSHHVGNYEHSYQPKNYTEDYSYYNNNMSEIRFIDQYSSSGQYDDNKYYENYWAGNYYNNANHTNYYDNKHYYDQVNDKSLQYTHKQGNAFYGPGNRQKLQTQEMPYENVNDASNYNYYDNYKEQYHQKNDNFQIYPQDETNLLNQDTNALNNQNYEVYNPSNNMHYQENNNSNNYQAMHTKGNQYFPRTD